jgi:FkbM family methyltransferase
MKISNIGLLRSVVLPVVKATAFDFSIHHQWTGDRLRLNSYRHKGYWYHGRTREEITMKAFSLLLKRGDTVVEAGGHIGYITLWFAKLVGAEGEVVVFEPGSNNLPYIRRNVSKKTNIALIEKGCGASETVLEFFEDDLSGQNNSFVKDFWILKDNVENAGGVKIKVESRKVEICRIDNVMENRGRRVDFVKIDTEGYELAVLEGCEKLFKQTCPPKFMVEVTENRMKILELFARLGYFIFNETGQRVGSDRTYSPNLFMLHPVHHKDAINVWSSANR